MSISHTWHNRGIARAEEKRVFLGLKNFYPTVSDANNDPELALAGAEDVVRRSGRESVRMIAASQDHVCHVAIA